MEIIEKFTEVDPKCTNDATNHRSLNQEQSSSDSNTNNTDFTGGN